MLILIVVQYLIIKNNYINSGIKKDLIITKEEVENSFKEAV